MEPRPFQRRAPHAGEVLQVRTIRLCIRGRVQGVGFRDALGREADRLGVTGWVRNRADGEVEAVVQGDAAALEALLAWARRGPPAARVERVDCGTPAPEHARSYARFERWPSA
jgi:acylphosphatase